MAEPKSREERLRDFYASRTSALEAVSWDLAEEATRDAAPELRKKGNDLFEAEDYEGAVEQYSAALKKAPSSVLHANRAAAYMMLGWWQQALRDCKAALRKDPDNLKALQRQGRVLLAMDDLEAAKAVVEDLELRGPKEVFQGVERPAPVVRRLRWLTEAARELSSLEQCQAFREAFGSKAELVSPLGLRLRKALVKALVERSDAVEHQRRIRPALAYNQRQVEHAGGISGADEIEELTPYAEEAVRLAGELLEDFPEDPDARYWRGKALLRLGRHCDAEKQFDEGP
ncbi:unnamed protein product, partial [Durusdinium trenchii]